ncbi:MAG: hypothetical protein ACRD5L_02215, partial [Bryobacteraceae bacterium]
ASTIYTSDQRSDMRQLERTLGITIERKDSGEVSSGTRRRAHVEKPQPASAAMASAAGPARLGRLPGELLQLQESL